VCGPEAIAVHLERHRHVETGGAHLGADVVAHRVVAPVRHVQRGDQATHPVDRAGAADADPDDLRTVGQRAERVAHDAADRGLQIIDRRGAAGRAAEAGVGHESAVGVDERRLDLRAAEVDGESEGCGHEDYPRRSAICSFEQRMRKGCGRPRLVRWP